MYLTLHGFYYITFQLMLLCYCCATDENGRRILPLEIQIREGGEMQLYLTEILKNEISCYIRTPNRKSCNLKVSTGDGGCDKRISYWSLNGECGAIIKDIQRSDEGWWRLSSKSNNEILVDAVKVIVLDKYNSTESNISITTGWQYNLEFTNVDKYCLVKHPQSEIQTTVQNECNILLSTTKADNGTWQAVVGITGQVHEITKTKEIFIDAEKIDSGYNKTVDPNSISIFCNLIAHRKSLELCRFSKSHLNETGLRLRDGLRSGRYAYYGSGLAQGECGLRIDSPEQHDFGTWYCTLAVAGSAPLGTSVFVSSTVMRSIEDSVTHTWSTSPVTTALMGKLQLDCYANVPLSYCWFSQPDGQMLEPTQTVSADATKSQNMLSFEYEELAIGKCSITLQNANINHSGTWICHMGPESLGTELTERITVRVSNTPLAAMKTNVTIAKVGDTISLICKTVPSATALHYCRFYSSNGFGINVNERVTDERPITHNNVNYWFAGSSISAGHCGLVIQNTNLEHIGVWTCAAKLETRERENEAFDTIYVIYTAEKDSGNLTAGATTGIIFAVLTVVIAIGVIIFAIKQKLRNLILPWCWGIRQRFRRNTTARAEYTPTMHTRNSGGSTPTSNSDSERV